MPASVLVVTHHSAADLPCCLTAIGRLAPAARELLLVDCASGDGSAEVAERHWPHGLAGEVIRLAENLGFAGGMNRALAAARGDWVLSLNPDAQPRPDYLARLLEAAEAASPRWRVGAVCGRLLRPAATGEARRLDACGMRLSPAWRHFDRGSGALDRGQFARRERVFGATGAATLWRRAALDDVALDGEIFDPRFHSYREDAELCFRLRARRWEVIYEPGAVAEHRRHNLPQRREAMSAAINRHSLKNRYLLRLYHQRALNLLLTAPFATARDVAALAYVLVRERSSLAAYGWLWRHRRELWARRRALAARRTAGRFEVERWFWRFGERGLPL